VVVKLPTFVRHSLRYRVIEPIRFGLTLASTSLVRQDPPVRMLLLSDQASYTSEQQFAPLIQWRRAILENLGVVLQRQLVSDALLLPKRLLKGYDVVALKLDFRTPLPDALRIAEALRKAMTPEAKLIYFDGDDDLCVQWPPLLPLVDAYVKKHCFSNRAEYRKVRTGKSNLTEYAARTHGVDFSADIIPRSEPVEDAGLRKVVVGWNIGLDDQIRRLCVRYPSLPPAETKDIDVVCRATVNAKSWIYPLRAAVIPLIGSMAPRYSVLTPETRVPQDVYYKEMLRARACVSPFGYGEICWRDFEAVACGSVLVKPDMSHVETKPDIFVAGETYVPVRWDYADLVPTLERLLEDPERCERIRARAFAVLHAWQDGTALIQQLRRVLHHAGVAIGSSSSEAR
jgi:hypothetical protein